MANALTNPTFTGATGSGTSTDWPGWTRVGMEYTAGQTLPRIRLTATASGTHTFTSDSIGTGNVGDTVQATVKVRQYTSSGSGGTKCEIRVMAGTRVVASAEMNTQLVAEAPQTLSGALIAGDEGQPITLQFFSDWNGRYFNLINPELEIVAVGPPPDTTPPSAPTGLTVAAPINKTTLSLSWTASTDNVAVAGYNVYEGSTRLNAHDGLLTGTSFIATGLAPGSTHTFTVRAVDTSNNQSVDSAPATGTTLASESEPDTTPPSVPTGLTVASKTDTSVTLTWTASTDDTAVVGYRVYDSGIQVNGSLVTGTTFTHSGLTASSAHSYTVRAADAAGNWSTDSSAVAVTTNSTPPDPDPDPEDPSPAVLRVLEFLGVPDDYPALLEIL